MDNEYAIYTVLGACSHLLIHQNQDTAFAFAFRIDGTYVDTGVLQFLSV